MTIKPVYSSVTYTNTPIPSQSTTGVHTLPDRPSCISDEVIQSLVQRIEDALKGR